MILCCIIELQCKTSSVCTYVTTNAIVNDISIPLTCRSTAKTGRALSRATTAVFIMLVMMVVTCQGQAAGMHLMEIYILNEDYTYYDCRSIIHKYAV